MQGADSQPSQFKDICIHQLILVFVRQPTIHYEHSDDRIRSFHDQLESLQKRKANVCPKCLSNAHIISSNDDG